MPTQNVHAHIQVFTIVWQCTQYCHVTILFPNTLSALWFGGFGLSLSASSLLQGSSFVVGIVET